MADICEQTLTDIGCVSSCSCKLNRTVREPDPESEEKYSVTNLQFIMPLGLQQLYEDRLQVSNDGIYNTLVKE